ncbi:hypothetical protein BJ165DRAFT_1399928 [Panaeolus papilionaceus]|nr:hypothetical protein BJ165DRAFT_1399928 [Panaeolus papilionaceus]
MESERDRRRCIASSVGGHMGDGSSISSRRRGRAVAVMAYPTMLGLQSEVEYGSMNGTNSEGEGEGDGEGEGRKWSVEPMGGWDVHCDDVGMVGMVGKVVMVDLRESREDVEGEWASNVDVSVGGEDVEFFLT